MSLGFGNYPMWALLRPDTMWSYNPLIEDNTLLLI
jgi:hypothetical protein